MRYIYISKKLQRLYCLLIPDPTEEEQHYKKFFLKKLFLLVLYAFKSAQKTLTRLFAITWNSSKQSLIFTKMVKMLLPI